MIRTGARPASVRVGGRAASRVYRGARLLWEAAPAVTPTAWLQMTPPEDTPTISSQAIGATTACPFGDWHREKRLGTAEQPPSGTATAGAGQSLDQPGGTRFHFVALPDPVVGHPANTTRYVQTGFKPGSTSSVQNARWPMTLEFETDSPRVLLRLRAAVASPVNVGLITVNGRRVTEQTTYTGHTFNSGSGYGSLLTFPDARPRVIRVAALNGTEGSWGGVGVETGRYVRRTSPPLGGLLGVIGDSFVNGAGGGQNAAGASVPETFVWRFAAQRGFPEVMSAGIGGTGFVTQLSTGADSLFRTRVAPVMAQNPAAVLVAGGRNDQGQDAAAVQSAAEEVLDLIGPGVPRYLAHTCTNSGAPGTVSALKAAAASRGVPFLDVDVDALPKIGDGIHLTWQGHQDFADRLATLL